MLYHEDIHNGSIWRFVAGIHQRYRGTLPQPTNAAAGTVRAEANHGEWLVLCLNPECNSALTVSKAEPFFLCAECGSPENEGRWYGVVWPDRLAEVEEVLDVRPTVNRNWVYPEPLAALLAENIVHDLPVPSSPLATKVRKLIAEAVEA